MIGRPRPARMALVAAALAVLAAVPAVARGEHLPLAGYDGSSPFDCRLQQVGTGVDFPEPDADPFCVEYDKTHQNVAELGVVDFLANEPARVAAANDKCFYYQHDHWRGSVEQHWEQSETYNWDGGYFFDKARGVGGVYVENFTLSNASFDPRAFPGFPDEWRPFFGWGRGGLQFREGIPLDQRCVEKARREDPYRKEGAPGSGEAAERGRPRLSLALRYRRGRTAAGRHCARSGIRARLAGRDAGDVERVTFSLSGRRLNTDRTAPFRTRVARRSLERRRGARLLARAWLADGRRAALAVRLRACGR